MTTRRGHGLGSRFADHNAEMEASIKAHVEDEIGPDLRTATERAAGVTPSDMISPWPRQLDLLLVAFNHTVALPLIGLLPYPF